MSLKNLFDQKNQLLLMKKDLMQKIAEVDEQINSEISQEFESSRKAKDKWFGALTLNVEGMDIKQTVARKTVWDQDMLANMCNELRASDLDPTDYMVVKYEIPEKLYNKLPEEKRLYFGQARTEKMGTVKVEMVEK